MATKPPTRCGFKKHGYHALSACSPAVISTHPCPLSFVLCWSKPSSKAPILLSCMSFGVENICSMSVIVRFTCIFPFVNVHTHTHMHSLGWARACRIIKNNEGCGCVKQKNWQRQQPLKIQDINSCHLCNRLKNPFQYWFCCGWCFSNMEVPWNRATLFNHPFERAVPFEMQFSPAISRWDVPIFHSKCNSQQLFLGIPQGHGNLQPMTEARLAGCGHPWDHHHTMGLAPLNHLTELRGTQQKHSRKSPGKKKKHPETQVPCVCL